MGVTPVLRLCVAGVTDYFLSIVKAEISARNDRNLCCRYTFGFADVRMPGNVADFHDTDEDGFAHACFS
jgi:hypothetical protein